ncbi:MAG: hypothetical protein M5T61_12175 [Acidimicrobiia bacterium]|nr:hypothetical protein [Acidimicrobiia bacterium]
MLTRLDDYPIHQTPEPLAHGAGASLNQYDRYFFNGYNHDGSLYFGCALGYYPNRRVMDAAFAVLRDGEVVSVIASRRAPLDPIETQVGPIKVAIEEPMQRFRITVDPNEAGVEADVVFTSRTAAIEEPRYTLRSGAVTSFDYTRLTQWGAWSGNVSVDGEEHQIVPSEHVGCRDRSWGVRPVGQQPPGEGVEPQFFWLWAPLWFDDCCVHFDVNEYGDGRQWHFVGAHIPLLGSPEEAVPGADSTVTWASAVEHSIKWQPGTRWSESADIRLHMHNAESIDIHLEPLATFQMRGLGYLHPEWGHGHWQGELEVHAERWRVADTNPMDPFYLHVQQLVRATWGDRVGVGVFEQIVLGAYGPYGFTGLFDGAP